MKRLGFSCILLVFCGLAAADQAAWIAREEAEAAAALVKLGSEVRHFAPPAGDTTWRSEKVESKSAEPVGQDNLYEVKINGKGVDLAYVYIQDGDLWVNLAMQIGLEVTDVPKVLGEEAVTESDEDVPSVQSGYKGLIDNKLSVYMELTRSGNDLGGSYEYASKGIPIRLEGTVDKEGTFTMTEYAEEEITGKFTGKLVDNGNRIEGEWATPDGAKHLPFAADKFYELTTEETSVKTKKGEIQGYITYPQFHMKNAAAAEKATKFVHDALRKQYDQFEKDARERFDEMQVSPGDDPVTMTFDSSDIRVPFYSDSLVSVVFSVYFDFAGAHPNTEYRPFNLAISENGDVRSVGLDDFLAKGADLGALSDKILADLKKQEAEWVTDGQVTSFEKGKLHALVAPHALVFLFSAYEVGSYAQGPFEVEIPYKDLGDSINREGVLKPVFQK